MDIKQIGVDLGVRYVLEGSVRKAENRMPITAQLIEAGTGSHFWAERFDGQIDDIFEVQGDLTAKNCCRLESRFCTGYRSERAIL